MLDYQPLVSCSYLKMTSVLRNSALFTLFSFATGRTPTFSRQKLNVKDIEDAAVADDALETPPPERRDSSQEEKSDQAASSVPKELIVTWNGKGASFAVP